MGSPTVWAAQRKGAEKRCLALFHSFLLFLLTAAFVACFSGQAEAALVMVKLEWTAAAESD